MNRILRALTATLVSIGATTAASKPTPAPNTPTVTIDLQNASPADFCQALFRDAEQVSYTLTPDIITDHRMIGIHLSAPAEQIHSAGLAYLKTLGYQVKETGGIFTVELIPPPVKPDPPPKPRRTEIYSPKFRDASYLYPDSLRVRKPLAPSS